MPREVPDVRTAITTNGKHAVRDADGATGASDSRNARSRAASVNTCPVMPSASAPATLDSRLSMKTASAGVIPQVVKDVPEDVSVRLEQAEFPADVAGGKKSPSGPCRK